MTQYVRELKVPDPAPFGDGDRGDLSSAALESGRFPFLKKAEETKKQAHVKHRFVDNYYFVEHPPAKVSPDNLLQFDRALPVWLRNGFDTLPPEEARRRLTILYRLVYPAPRSMPRASSRRAAEAPAAAPTGIGPAAVPKPAATRRIRSEPGLPDDNEIRPTPGKPGSRPEYAVGRDGALPPLRIRSDRIRSGTEAAVGPERRQVGGLVEEPEPLPVVAGQPEVFRVDEQFFDPLGPVGRIVRQGDRGTPLADGEDRHHEGQGRKGFLIPGSSRLRLPLGSGPAARSVARV